MFFTKFSCGQFKSKVESVLSLSSDENDRNMELCWR